jgi:hypothetical protein
VFDTIRWNFSRTPEKLLFYLLIVDILPRFGVALIIFLLGSVIIGVKSSALLVAQLLRSSASAEEETSDFVNYVDNKGYNNQYSKHGADCLKQNPKTKVLVS